MNVSVRIDDSWKQVLVREFESPEWETLSYFVKDEYKHAKVYPPPKYIFNAFDLCPFEKVKVVILGQDPYHGASQAHGLSFSVPEGVTMPPSLKNIYKELNNDLDIEIPADGNLESWAKQGVLLLNATLTVRAGQPGSHQGKGWEEFTDAVIRKISEKKEHVVFMLWGNFARAKKELIDASKHLILEAAHPSPYSASNGFFGCKHFSRTNQYLISHHQPPIFW